MGNFGIFKGFSDKLFEGELPTQLGYVGSVILISPLLDSFPNAAAAYSLRKLRSTYTSDCIRVRRSSDNTEQDIGFTSFNILDTSALTTFCGSGNGFVTTWYDQSGNSRNATQTTAANQPQIVSNGNIITENGRPTVLGLGSNTSMNCGTALISTSSSANFSIFSVIASKNLNLNFRIPFSQYNASDAGRLICYSSTTGSKSNVQIGSQSTEITGTATTNNALYYYARHSGNTLITGYNSETSATATTTQAITNTNSVLMNAIGSGGGFDDAMQEIVIYNLDNNSNRTGIQNNQSLYYNITL